jgi:hypothetical protein
MNQIRKIYSLTGDYCATFEELIDLLLKTKRENVKFSVDDLANLVASKKNVAKIIDILISAKKEGIILLPDDIKNAFYSDNDQDKIISYLNLSKVENVELSVHQIKEAFFRNIDIKKLIDVRKLLKKKNLKIPFSKLLDLLEKKINIVKCLNILENSENAAKEELFKLGIFVKPEIEQLANIYTISGKEKFKKKLEEIILANNYPTDPARLYKALMKSSSSAFKINLELFLEYVSYDFEPDIEEINETYIKARNNKLQITYEQLVKLAEKKIKINEFVDAQIKSGANE